MGNIITTIRRFLSNKNTVTIIGVLLGIVVLYIGYNYRVKHAVETVTVPYAKKTISATTAITNDAVGTMEVLRSTVGKTMISSYAQVISTTRMCVAEKTNIPEGSFFYTGQIKECTSISSNILDDMEDGYSAVVLDVDLRKTFGNSMYPGKYIDLYVKTTDDTGKLIYSRLLSKLPILDVRDSNGQSLYYSASTSTVPAVLLFAVPNYDTSGTNLYLLLSKATMLNGIDLVPVPGNASYSSEIGETRVSSEYLKNLILQQTAVIPDEDVRDFLSRE
ncbi:MAG: hypothetical protein K2J20_04150 [Bacilli bacterium]|nr:hypothetical protein [Bacilli bacterium]